jgi:surfeit locus 1 family protein
MPLLRYTIFMDHPLLRPAWIAKHTFALLIFVTMIGLGFWQLDRLEQRRAYNAERLAVLDQPATPLDAALADPLAIVGRKVRLSGVYRNDESVVLRNQRSNSGVDGVHLITPLQLSGSEQAVLVDRGWIPASQSDRSVLGAYAVEREVTVEGLALAGRSAPEGWFAPSDLPLPGETRIDAWLRVDVVGIQQQSAATLLPIYIEQLPRPDQSAGSLPQPRDPRALGEGSHFSYALQWFSFAAILSVVYAGLMRQELRKL